MMAATDYYEGQKNRISKDITSFADPGSVQLDSTKRTLSARWRMHGQTREVRFNLSQDSGVTVKKGNETLPYGTYLAGTEMADLHYVAQMIGQARSQEIFVPTRAERTEADAADGQAATVLLTDLLEDDEPGRTEIIMITGEAGAGKTRVLKELVLQQAERYLRGETGQLLLYVNAQGRALARLNEALATELQDLRVNLTYHSVATLARTGLLVPVIDGFDELLGISGYDDAFNSLGAFLEQLEGEGRLVASARSVYYEEEFLSRASRISANGTDAWCHVPVKIVPWDDRDQAKYLQELAQRRHFSQEDTKHLHEGIKKAFEGRKELAAKPLFFAKTVDLLIEDPQFSGGDDLLETLSRRYLKREQTEKLLDREQRPLLTEKQLEVLMEELAEEMWNQETSELDDRSVREVAEYVLEGEQVSDSARQTVVERMPTIAFLASGENDGRIRFEHEVFFFHFLARTLARQFLDHKELRVILSRAPLPEFVAERLAFELRRRGRLSSLDDMQEILDQLSEAGKPRWLRTRQVRENAGLVVMALLREFSAEGSGDSVVADRTINKVVFPGGHLRDVTLQNCTLVDVEFRRTDLVGTTFKKCIAHAVLLEEPLVRIGATRLELSGLDPSHGVVGLRQASNEGTRTLYAPEEIARVLRDCGAPIESPDDGRKVAPELMTLLDRLMRAYGRANIVCDGDQNLGSLFGDPRWATLRDLLIEHDMISAEDRPASGRPKTFFRRRYAPDEIMKGLNKSSHAKPQIARFWDGMEALG